MLAFVLPVIYNTLTPARPDFLSTHPSSESDLKYMEYLASDNKHEFNIPNDTGSSSTYQLKRVRQLHREILRLVVLGHKDTEIAEILGITPVTVAYTRKSEIVQGYLDKLHTERDESAVDMTKTIRELSPLALDVSTSILVDEDADQAVRARIAKDLLDRAGYKPANVNLNSNGKMSRSQIEQVKERARMAGIHVVDEDEVEEAELVESDADEGEDLNAG